MGESPLQAQYAEAQAQLLRPLSHTPLFEHSLPTTIGAAPAATAAPILHDSGDAGNIEEEPYTIKCICGFLDDDGSTVLCEQCNTWQHIECYYPGIDIPEVHKCTDCCPRPAHLNPEEAKERQKKLRESLRNTEDERRVKRTGPKAHRKSRVKELGQTHGQTNGWQYVEALNNQSDANSGSPSLYDQPPPKRSKTLHKSATSLNASISRPVNYRHRSNSNVDSSPIKLPPEGYLAQFLSPEFVHVHQTNTEFTPAQANLHLDIGVTNQLSAWLDDPEAFSAAANGLSQNEVFKHFPQPIEELETAIQKRLFRDTRAMVHGAHPVWPYLTIDQDLLAGDFVGELRGSIGHRDDYRAEPSNNWEQLRHPEHFVFFHPCLPIYIDCRSEGTLLRYARRSCRPNLKLETIITGAREYRFCFTAITSIPRDTEITVGWDTLADSQLQEAFKLGSTAMNDSKRLFVQDWVVTILAHFGGCACNPADDSFCLMEHFDPRLDRLKTRSRPSRVSKSRKSIKKSPSTSGRTTGQRAGSEGVNSVEVDEDDEDRSTSRSSRSHTSRDASPSVAGSPCDSSAPLGNELSERDKKKLMQQERLFDKLAQEEHQGQRRKKRAGGSNANTPVPNSLTKHLARSFSTNPNTPVSVFRSRPGDSVSSYFGSLAVRSPSDQSSRARSPMEQQHGQRRALKAAQPFVRPAYVDNFTQTTRYTVGNLSLDQSRSPVKSYMALSQRILRRSHRRALRLTSHLNIVKSMRQSNDKHGNVSGPTMLMGFAEIVGQNTSLSPHDSPDLQGIKMTDIDELEPRSQRNSLSLDQKAANTLAASEMLCEFSITPVLPWPSSESPGTDGRAKNQSYSNTHVSDLHVELSPPSYRDIGTPASSPLSTMPDAFSRASVPLTASSGSNLAIYAPVTPPILTSTSINSVNSNTIQPSPAVKKMSLSDYLMKRKAEIPTLEKPSNLEASLGSLPSLARETLQKGQGKPRAPPDIAISFPVVKGEESILKGESIESDAME